MSQPLLGLISSYHGYSRQVLLTSLLGKSQLFAQRGRLDSFLELPAFLNLLQLSKANPLSPRSVAECSIEHCGHKGSYYKNQSPLRLATLGSIYQTGWHHSDGKFALWARLIVTRMARMWRWGSVWLPAGFRSVGVGQACGTENCFMASKV